ncbi:MAG: hypothetical protein IT457_25225 [Planctomycetes bacterium]|nr:hypothetical protein [Planctomycetota bacterium]
MAGPATEQLNDAIRANRRHADRLLLFAIALAAAGLAIDVAAISTGAPLVGLAGALVVGVALVPLRWSRRCRRENDLLAVYAAALRSGLEAKAALELANDFARSIQGEEPA